MIIQARNIRKSFGSLEVLKGIDLDVASGEIVSIVGSSGAGKTTLLQILGTLSAPDPDSSILIDGAEVAHLSPKASARLRRETLGFVFQSHQLLPEFTALENVLIPAMLKGEGGKATRQRALELLRLLGLEARQGHLPRAMSGGECQRVAVARALMNQPKVIFADEPSGSLDSHNKAELHSLFFRLREELGQTFVIVTHDEEFAVQADRMISLHDGRIARIDSRPIR